jgi:hypothetical protein
MFTFVVCVAFVCIHGAAEGKELQKILVEERK